MNVAAITAVASSALTALSVLWAIYVFRHTEDQNAFARFRLGLVDLRYSLTQFAREINEGMYTSVARAIVSELRRLLPTGASPTEIDQYLSMEEHRNFVVGAVYLGLESSAARTRVEATVVKLERGPYEYRERLPVLADLLRALAFYPIEGFRSSVSPEYFMNLLSEQYDKAIQPSLLKMADAGTAWADIEDSLAINATNVASSEAGPVMNNALEIMQLVLDKFSALSDAELRTESKMQRSILPAIRAVDNMTAIEDAIDLLKMIRSHFTNDEWDGIIESKTRIFEAAHQKLGDGAAK